MEQQERRGTGEQGVGRGGGGRQLGRRRLDVRAGAAPVAVERAHAEVALAALDGVALHLDGPVGAVEAVVQAAGVADGVAGVVAAPQRGDGAGAVEAGHGQAVVVVVVGGGRGRGRGVGAVVVFDHHAVVERGTALARGGAAGAVAAAVALARALQLRQDGHGVGQALQVHRAVVVVGAVVEAACVADEGAVGAAAPERGLGGAAVGALLARGGPGAGALVVLCLHRGGGGGQRVGGELRGGGRQFGRGHGAERHTGITGAVSGTQNSRNGERGERAHGRREGASEVRGGVGRGGLKSRTPVV